MSSLNAKGVLGRLPSWVARIPWSAIGLWAVSRLIVAVVAVAASAQMGTRIPDLQLPGQSVEDRFLWIFGRFWDGDWYTKIATYGYTFDEHSVAFFPGWPVIMDLAARTFGMDHMVAGVLLAHCLSLVGGVLLWYLVRAEFDDNVAFWSVAFLFFAPSAVHFSANYTESVYFLSLATSFFLAQKDKWVWAGLIAGIGSAARPSGFVIVPVFALWYLHRKGWKPPLSWATIRDMIGIGLGASGAALYALYLITQFGGLGAYTKAHLHWNRDFGALTYVEMLFSPERVNALHVETLLQGWIPGILTLVATILLIQYRRFHEALLIFLTMYLGLGSGSWEAAQRHALVLFPLYILLARIPSERVKAVVLALSAVLMGYWTALFGGGWHFT